MDQMQDRAQQKQDIDMALQALLAHAKEHGFAISVWARPLRPLAMGHYTMVGEVREWPAAQRSNP